MIAIKNAQVRRILKIAVPFVLIPAVIAAGILVFDEKRYAFISLAVAVLAVALFIAGFEKKQTGTRRLIIVAVMVALSVVGRFIPLFKPITALTIITAMYLGGEAGFLVGSLSAVISNFYFGQGPWTPFQMFAWGLIGLIAGFLADPLKKSRVLLLVCGFLSGVLFSFVMDIWTVLWYNESLDWALYLSALVTALPYTIMYSVSNVVFLFLIAKPFGEKLERVKLKYGV
ncbi:MAG TPA: ECF transporter S component [Oscillospiraceae bacterium]|nr:ECF transporter S component [Oscillospiraceae bacterium]HPF55202.1 ECF transporter S component [Clostridiales bacterium]HPK36414.1 ECF transporter S component [Oscillospiraceae bacterium]HPR75718.1 ECF transporter S component [Oscillospiraceae bacterium]